MTTNYRGQPITYEALFEVLTDYLEGRREYSVEDLSEEDYDGENFYSFPCVYRKGGKADSPVACLAGSFIADEQYNDFMEGIRFASLGDKYYTLGDGVTASLVSGFQCVHDYLARGDYRKVKLLFSSLVTEEIPVKYSNSTTHIKTLIDNLISSTN